MRCPDPTTNPDYCDVCEGWGHRCPEWRRTHSAQDYTQVLAVYASGWNPTTFYHSVEDARKSEAETAKTRRPSLIRLMRLKSK